jgi:two-component system cell cycle response regulator DivK
MDARGADSPTRDPRAAAGDGCERSMSSEPILIVDDNPTNMKLVSYLLIAHGYTVRSAANAKETLEVVKDFHPRLILMDVQLPDMSGLELTRLIKQDAALRDVPIVALTAYAMRGDEEKARAAGCDGYITKPIDTRAFPTLIAQFIGKVDVP